MKNLENLIDSYLSKPSDYAIQISGNWGVGKTYNYRNTLEKIICSKQTNHNGGKNYKPIYISLFGLKSIEDISTKIVFEFYQSIVFKSYFKKGQKSKKILQISQAVLKIGFKGFLNFNRLGNTNEYLTDIKAIGQNCLDANELLICFDDIERKDSSLNIEDLTGYVNSLVDDGVKVIMIANEDILFNKGADYKNFKEKIIGISVEYLPDVKDTLLSIIRDRYSGYSMYLNFLTERIEMLISISTAANNNFRHIIYALDNLHQCYSIIYKDIIDLKHSITNTVESELLNISKVILALSIEYKSSNLKHSDLQKYTEVNLAINRRLFPQNFESDHEDENDKTELNIFIDKYNIERNEYRFYDSIYNFVTATEEFSSISFISEVERKFNLHLGNILPQYELLNSLGYDNCFRLSDEEYERKTNEMIEYATAGSYQAADYLTVLHFSERLDNVLNLDLNQVKDKIITGLTKVIQNTTSIENSSFGQFEMSGRFNDISPLNRELYEIGISEIERYKEKAKEARIQYVVNLLITNPQKFRMELNSDSDLAYLSSHFPILNYIKIDTLFESVIKADGQVLHFLGLFLQSRYKDREKLNSEAATIKALQKQLIEYRNLIDRPEQRKIWLFIFNNFLKILSELDLDN